MKRILSWVGWLALGAIGAACLLTEPFLYTIMGLFMFAVVRDGHARELKRKVAELEEALRWERQ